MPHLVTELGRMIWGITAAEIFKTWLARSGRPGATHTPTQLPNRIGRIMSDEYEIVGHDFDDELMGAIGMDAELIGDDEDEDFLEELALSGDYDDDDIDGEDLEDILVSGAGDSEIIGARRGRRRKSRSKKAARRAMLRRLIRRNAGAVVNRGLDRRRRYPLGFVPTTITAGTSLQIPAAPQNLYRPERLVIPSDISFDTGVRDIKVGNTSQLVQSVEVPAALFSEVAINTGVTFDTAEVGNQVSVDARNKSGSSFEFSAGLVGTIAK